MDFHAVREEIQDQYRNIRWLPDSGLTAEQLMAQLEQLHPRYQSATLFRAYAFLYIAGAARLAVDPKDIFQEKLDGVGLIKKFRIRQEKALKEEKLPLEVQEVTKAWSTYGAFHATSDYSHTSPNSKLLLEVGFDGLRDRVMEAANREGLSEKQQDFYRSCDIMLTAMCTAARRLSEAIAAYEGGYLGKVSKETYDDMVYARKRIAERVLVEAETE